MSTVMPSWLSFAAALALSIVHVVGGRLTLGARPRSAWLSAAGGVSVAYVFVHVLPELARRQQAFERPAGNGAADGLGVLVAALEQHVYVIALVGLAVFFGLERLVRRSTRREARAGRAARPEPAAFWLHLASFAAYNVLIGYLVVHREGSQPRDLAVFASALALHLVVNDQALRELHGALYADRGRWLLAAAPLVGWAIGSAIEIGSMAIAACFAFLAGGVVLNVLKEELPEERDSRFGAFAVGAGTYALLLLATT